MKAPLSIISLLLWLSLPACGQQTLDEKLEKLYHHTVPLIKAPELAEWRKADKDLVVLDIRSIPEYQVSHIQGAKLVDYESFKESDIKQLSKSSKIVVYCSVGYRSERIGEKMKAMGFEEVYNLYGGIFQWKDQGYAVVDRQGHSTDSVHTYNKSWSKWLESGIKVYD